MYDQDLHRWTIEQSAALRRRAGNELDWDNLAEEIEALGRSDRREIESRLEILLTHLLKLAYQPHEASPSWRGSVREARNRIARIIEESPSLRAYPAAELKRAYALPASKPSIKPASLRQAQDRCRRNAPGRSKTYYRPSSGRRRKGRTWGSSPAPLPS